MRNNGFILIFLFILRSVPVFSQQAEPALSIEELVQEAITQNPRLRSFRLQAQADSLKIPQSGTLPDPMISLNLLNLPLDNFVMDQEAMSGKQIALKQSFPFFGKLDLKEEIARVHARVSQANYEELKSQLVRDVKNLYYDLFYTDEAIATSEKNYTLITEFVTIAEKKYSVGKGLQQDVLKAQVERSKMTRQIISLKQKRQQLEANLNTLLNRPAQRLFGKTKTPPLALKQYDRKHLQQTASKQRALLKAWQLRIEQRKAQNKLAQKSYLPDFSLFAAYTQRDVLQSGMGGVDFLSAGISFNVPIYFWRKQDKLVQEKQIAQKQAETAYLNVQNQVNTALENALTALDKNAQLLELYSTGIIPQATQSLQAAMIGYQTDKVDFLTLINNQKTLFNFELEYSRILSAYQKNLAELEYIIGTRVQ